MIAMIIISIIVLVILIGTGFLLYKKISDGIKQVEYDKSIDPDIVRTQDFLPFKEDGVKDNVIDMGGHYYVGIVEVASTNYYLRTEDERRSIRLSFMRFLNSLTHRIAIIIQTKEMDYETALNNLKESSIEVCDRYDGLKKLANMNYMATSQLADYMKESKQKRKYIIVPFQEATFLEELSDEDKREYSLTELDTRISMLVSNLEPVGVKAKRLNTKEILDLLYSSYNRESSKDYENIYSGEYTTLFVDGDNPADGMTPKDYVDHALYEAQMRIKGKMPKNTKERNEFTELIVAIEAMRKDLNKEGGIKNGDI